ncbi:hypothetical protein GFS31_39650 [Leptolyngbya sp. BL0902]|nr:hypothetical protein GFS31_39650 [Leptolyngbya sp. BL0902]
MAIGKPEPIRAAMTIPRDPQTCPLALPLVGHRPSHSGPS